MYLEVRSDDPAELCAAVKRQIESGVPAAMHFTPAGDFLVISINTATDEETPTPV